MNKLWHRNSTSCDWSGGDWNLTSEEFRASKNSLRKIMTEMVMNTLPDAWDIVLNEFRHILSPEKQFLYPLSVDGYM